MGIINLLRQIQRLHAQIRIRKCITRSKKKKKSDINSKMCEENLKKPRLFYHFHFELKRDRRWGSINVEGEKFSQREKRRKN